MLAVILTLFPQALRAYLDESILGIARAGGKLRVELVDFRDFTHDRHRTVDDRPFGGGPGMVLKPEPIFEAVEDCERRFGPLHRILLCPRGRRFAQADARTLAADHDRLLLLCGRYEGFDERIRTGLEWDEIRIGDFVLAGGELAALCVLEATARLIPGVLGHDESAAHESFETRDPDGGATLLDHPQYTRPREYRGMAVPDVLLSGDHGEIARWRLQQSRRLTEQAETAAERTESNRTADEDPNPGRDDPGSTRED